MARVNLNSTLLNAATYQDQSALLELEFRSGAIYHYSGVPAQTYQQLLRAQSQGGFFNRHIRNHFNHAKIDHAHSGAIPDSAHHHDTE
jgi:hypothetical protein